MGNELCCQDIPVKATIIEQMQKEIKKNEEANQNLMLDQPVIKQTKSELKQGYYSHEQAEKEHINQNNESQRVSGSRYDDRNIVESEVKKVIDEGNRVKQNQNGDEEHVVERQDSNRGGGGSSVHQKMQKKDVKEVILIETKVEEDPLDQLISEKQMQHPLPEVDPLIQKVIHEQKFFAVQLQSSRPTTKIYGQDTYSGTLKENRPHGIGKMYKHTGEIYIGHFEQGKAQGDGVYIMKDGSYYKGQFNSNKAQGKNGEYISNELSYRGEFKNNTFHGFGNEKGSFHEFQGEYQNGCKLKGVLSWKASDGSYLYEGDFNKENQFHGQGNLKEPHGNYKGAYLNGKKHGKGVFQGVNGIRYEGEYVNDYREGTGRMVDEKGIKGVPHGRGRMAGQSGVAREVLMKEGLQQNI